MSTIPTPVTPRQAASWIPEFNDIVGNYRIREHLGNCLRLSSPEEDSNVLLVGPPGTGKTSTFLSYLQRRLGDKRLREDDAADVATFHEELHMAHNLATTNGRPAMMYVGPPPWHKLGTKLDEPATAEEAIVAAGLDYTVELHEMTSRSGKPVPKRRAVVRSDTQDILGVVGHRYVPIQNRDAFGFLNALVTEGELRFHTAGGLGKGERIWLLAKLPDSIRVKQTDDLIDKFLLLSNAHDGSAALRAYFSPIRVVCQNTLNLAERRSTGQGVSIYHTGEMASKIGEAQKVLGLAEAFYDDATATINFMAGHNPSKAQLDAFFKTLYPDPEDPKNQRAKNIRDTLFDLFEAGIGQHMPGIRHTTWAALNAVTELIDHNPTGGDLRKADRQLRSIWFGHGARIKSKAWQLAMKMAADQLAV